DVAAIGSRSHRIVFFLQRAAREFVARTFEDVEGTAQPVAIAAADVDGDGRTDLVCANTSTRSISLLLQRPDGSFALSADSPIAVPDGPPTAVSVVDVDGDGDQDIVVAANQAVIVFFQLSRGRFVPDDSCLGRLPYALRIDAPGVGGTNNIGTADVDGD